jgi:hypothetical protein
MQYASDDRDCGFRELIQTSDRNEWLSPHYPEINTRQILTVAVLCLKSLI